MATEFLGAKLNDLGQPVFPTADADAEGRAAFFKMFFETETGRRFQPICTRKNKLLLGEYLERKFPGDTELTLDQFEKLVALMMDTHSFPEQQPTATPTAVEDSRPRNPDGTFRSEYDLWANSPGRSSAELHSRAKADPDGFGAWMRDRLTEQTVQESPYKVVGAPIRETTQADQQVLGEFVELYRLAPAASLKARAGFIHLGDMKLTPQQFETLVTAAAEAGLL